MKLVLVWELLLFPSIVRYCVASDPNPDLQPESDPTSSSISLPEEISSGNPTISTTDASNLQSEEPSPDRPVDIGESVAFLSQSKSDSCVLDRIQAPSRRKRFRRQSCLSPFIAPEAAKKNPVSIPSWGSNYPSISRPKQAPIPGGIIKEDRKLCADEWHNMPVCAQESFAERDYLPFCRPRLFSCQDGDILFCCGFVALRPWATIGADLSNEQVLNLKYPFYGIQCLKSGVV